MFPWLSWAKRVDVAARMPRAAAKAMGPLTLGTPSVGISCSSCAPLRRYTIGKAVDAGNWTLVLEHWCGHKDVEPGPQPFQSLRAGFRT